MKVKKLFDAIRRSFRREHTPVVRRNVHAPCDTCGQVNTNLIDGLCDWCHRFYKAHK